MRQDLDGGFRLIEGLVTRLQYYGARLFLFGTAAVNINPYRPLINLRREGLRGINLLACAVFRFILCGHFGVLVHSRD